jgi:hypothetical protein
VRLANAGVDIPTTDANTVASPASIKNRRLGELNASAVAREHLARAKRLGAEPFRIKIFIMRNEESLGSL